MSPRVNWTLVGQIGLVGWLCFVVTWTTYKVGSPVQITRTAAFAPVWIFGPIMVLVAVLSKWWRP